MSDSDTTPVELTKVPCGAEWVLPSTGTTYVCAWPALCPACEKAYDAASSGGKYEISHPGAPA